jgi:hypothetical protein
MPPRPRPPEPGVSGGRADVRALMRHYAAATAPRPGGDMISKVTEFLTQQPQLMVAGQIGLTPLSGLQRRERLAGVNLFDALETVARL